MKSEPIQTNDPNLTAYAVGDMSPSESFQFEQLLRESPAAQAELEEIKETIGWVRKGYASELKASDFSDPNLTAYALGETGALNSSTMSKVEQTLKDSSEAQAELAGIEETIGWLKDGFAAELNDTVCSDANLTAYALGETEVMSASAMADVEESLKHSPEVREELEAIEETIGWLRDGFAKETQTPRLLEEPEVAESNIVVGEFKRPGIKTMLSGLAAVLTGMLVVGALISNDRAKFPNGHGIANAAGNPVEVFQKVEVPSALPEQKSFFAIPEVDKVFSGGNNGFVLANYDTVDGMMVPRLAGLDHSQLPDILEVAAFNDSVGQKGPANPLSYISYENLEPTDILEIKSDELNSGTTLPGIDAIGKGMPSFGTYRFQNEDSKELSDEEFGHGELSFEIRSRIIDGKLVETVRLVDTRKGPDGKETKTVKEFVREGSDVGKPIHSLLPGNLGQPQPAIQGDLNDVSSENGPSIGAVTPAPANPIVTEFFKINSELSAVRDQLSKGPTGADLEALEAKLSRLIDQQTALGRKLEANIGM